MCHPGALQEPRNGVNQERQNDRIEPEGDHSVEQRYSPHPFCRDLHVGHLTGHADHERKVGEIKVVWILVTGKVQSLVRGLVAITVAIIQVRVMQAVDGVKKEPRYRDGALTKYYRPG